MADDGDARLSLRTDALEAQRLHDEEMRKLEEEYLRWEEDQRAEKLSKRWRVNRLHELEIAWVAVESQDHAFQQVYLQQIVDGAVTADEVYVANEFVMHKDGRLWRDWAKPLAELQNETIQREFEEFRRQSEECKNGNDQSVGVDALDDWRRRWDAEQRAEKLSELWRENRLTELEFAWVDVESESHTVRRKFLQQVIDNATTEDEMSVVNDFVREKDLHLWSYWTRPLQQLRMATWERETEERRKQSDQRQSESDEQADQEREEWALQRTQLLEAAEQAERDGAPEVAHEIRLSIEAIESADREFEDSVLADERRFEADEHAERARAKAEAREQRERERSLERAKRQAAHRQKEAREKAEAADRHRPPVVDGTSIQTQFCERCGQPEGRENHTNSGACRNPKPGVCRKCGHRLTEHSHSPTGGGDQCSVCGTEDGCNKTRHRHDTADDWFEDYRRDRMATTGIHPDNPFASDLMDEAMGLGTSEQLRDAREQKRQSEWRARGLAVAAFIAMILAGGLMYLVFVHTNLAVARLFLWGSYLPGFYFASRVWEAEKPK